MATQREQFNSSRGVLEGDIIDGTATAFLHTKCLEVEEHSLSGKRLDL